MLSKILQSPLLVKQLVENWNDDNMKTIQYHYAIRRAFNIINDRILDGETWDGDWSCVEVVAAATDYAQESVFTDDDCFTMEGLIRDHYQPELNLVNALNYAQIHQVPTWSRLTKLD